MIINLLIIGIGGFVGAISRYLIFMVDRHFYHQYDFPLGTLFVNLVGSLLIGIALGMSVKYNILSRGSPGHYLFITGFLGAFTTFSTFSQDSFILLMEKQYWFFITNILLNVIAGITLTMLGYFLVLDELPAKIGRLLFGWGS
uniref:Fluoride-specific ion channel FluC n=1 Tax=Candidatus Kentrum sp. TUN TaxID=2126343 RepID=A0A450ZUC0_9GAMM|nr:MAG: CrcB protein [Candidatus Kentron sp. TUN]VFK51161.1 MAG: CrcB protein [Candidatus Kentron sp. TUN]VFK57328.1 MAG: CrcB protein [Candidatus Kentron sp. TUN]